MAKHPCPHSPAGVWCERKQCTKCGWNPEVANARLEAIIAKMAEEEESHGSENTMG